MKLHQLKHAILSVTSLLEVNEVTIVGSQSILGSYSENQLPEENSRSIEVDMNNFKFDITTQERNAFLIEERFGQDTYYHETQGFYIDGVTIKTSKPAKGWESRLKKS